MAKWHDAVIIDRVDWNPHLFSLYFSCSEFPTFTAGQFAKIGVEMQDGTVISRPYSLVNSPQSDVLEVIAVPVEEGSLSPKLHALQKGDKLKIMSPATGFLVLNEVPASENLLMLATGTGVGPFLSILETREPWRTYKNITLVYGVRKFHDLAYLAKIEKWQNDHAEQFSFVPVVSREKHAGTIQGRIPALIKSGVIQNQTKIDINPENTQVMLCGNPAMIADAMQVLNELGFKKHLRRSPGQISMERYW
ncbi:ferredoxin--NADP reductase [Brumicola pallidula]|uniref:ferredoxin--NADP(+) reductase n=1 Tax=Brumicola pallidula DSM 14239 = ACAM 615 TaxID=1121922 RepID=K6YVQ0_9ALTE|nr:ferredoxin--NADP reductase [Glaciecola pallidula]GAC28086.1 ferredoxin--NADP+ reductase [Glaciecola pallidula DSM 14239 = ACAM 615]